MVVLIWQSGNLLEKSEYSTERIHSSEMGFARIFAPSFKDFPEILSIAAALSIFTSFSNCSTRSAITFENLNLDGSSPKLS